MRSPKFRAALKDDHINELRYTAMVSKRPLRMGMVRLSTLGADVAEKSRPLTRSSFNSLVHNQFLLVIWLLSTRVLL